MKTKSAVKKRFKVTSKGKVIGSHAGKSHCMIHKTNKQSRSLRGTTVIAGKQADNLKKYFLPYS